MALTGSALTTLANVKEELGITTGTDDAYLERLIQSASALFSTLCDREFEFEDERVEKVSGHGTAFISISRRPLKSITKIEFVEDLDIIDPTEFEIHGDGAEGLIRRRSGWRWTTSGIQELTFTPLPGQERKGIEVTYDGGFVTPQQVILDGSLTRDLPFDLEDAVIQLVTYRFRARGATPTAAGPIKSEKLLTHSVTYDTDNSLATGSGKFAAAISQDVQSVIDKFANIVIA